TKLSSESGRRRGSPQRPVGVFNSSPEDLIIPREGRILLSQRIGVDALKENPVAASHTRFSIPKNIPSKTKARGKIVPVITGKASRNAWIIRKNHAHRGIGNLGRL